MLSAPVWMGGPELSLVRACSQPIFGVCEVWWGLGMMAEEGVLACVGLAPGASLPEASLQPPLGSP